ncbi:FACT complex subunit spt-16 [Cucumispora dikerogammari]|nr:FACT complex subunit spt-16 [Cucumispora dikerogammari]
MQAQPHTPTIKLSPSIYTTRIKTLPQEINGTPLCFLLPKSKDIPQNSISSSIYLYLFGYEFPETLLIIYNNEVIVLSSESKLVLLENLNNNIISNNENKPLRLFNKTNLQKSLLSIGKLIGQKIFLIEPIKIPSEFTSQCINYFINTNTENYTTENQQKLITFLYKNNSLDFQSVSIYYFIQSVLNTLIDKINVYILNNMFRVNEFTDVVCDLIDEIELTSGYLNTNNEFVMFESDLIDFFGSNLAKKFFFLNLIEDGEDVLATETNFDLFKYIIELKVVGYCVKVTRTFSVNCKKRFISMSDIEGGSGYCIGGVNSITEHNDPTGLNDPTEHNDTTEHNNSIEHNDPIDHNTPNEKGKISNNNKTTLETHLFNLYTLFDLICSLIHNKKIIPDDVISQKLTKSCTIKLNIVGLLPVLYTLTINEYNEQVKMLNNLAINVILINNNIEISDIVLITDISFCDTSNSQNITSTKPKGTNMSTNPKLTSKMGYTINYTTYNTKYLPLYLHNGTLNTLRHQKDLYFEKAAVLRIEMLNNQKDLLNILIENRLLQLKEPTKRIKTNILITKPHIKIKRDDKLIIENIDNLCYINIPIKQYMISIPYTEIRNVTKLSETIMRINLINNPNYAIKSINYFSSNINKDIERFNAIKTNLLKLTTTNNLEITEKPIYKLNEIKIELDFKMTKKLSSGSLEIYNKIIVFTTNNQKLMIENENIKTIYFNYKTTEEDKYFIHFHLKKPIYFNNKLTKNVQFFYILIEKITDTSKFITKKEELEIEFEELKLRNKYIQQIKTLINVFGNTELNFNSKVEILGFKFPAILKEKVNFYFTEFSLICLEHPFFFIDLNFVEVVSFERILSDSFDLIFIINKEMEFSFQGVFNIEIKYIWDLKQIINQKSKVFIESKTNINWDAVIKSIKLDLVQFYEGGAWKDLMEDELESESETISKLSDSDATSNSESSDDTDENTEDLEEKSDKYSESMDDSESYESESGNSESDDSDDGDSDETYSD